MRTFILLAVLLAATTAVAAPTGPAGGTPAPYRASAKTSTALPEAISSTPEQKETSIERITRLRAQRQGTRVVPRHDRFPHAPDVNRRPMTLQRMMEDLEPFVPCRRVRIRKKPRVVQPPEIVQESPHAPDVRRKPLTLHSVVNDGEWFEPRPPSRIPKEPRPVDPIEIIAADP